MAQAAIDEIVALNGEKVLEFLAVEERGVEGIVIGLDRTETGTNEIRSRHEMRHDLGAGPDLGFGEPRIVARGAFQIEQRGEHVLGEDLPKPARDRGRQRGAVDAAVLGSLDPDGPLQAEATRLEVEHGLSLVKPHEELGARA